MSILRNKLFYLCVGVALLIPMVQQVYASHVMIDIHSDVGLFYEQLAPDGNWVTTKSGDLVWTPTKTPVDWRPYTIGQWSYTEDQGWLWVSGWSWGWATFHYGRWFFDKEYGWAWKPGSQWAPAWVAWRVGNGLIGWAPLSPEVKLTKGEQRLSNQQLDQYIDLYSWSFVPVSEIFSTNLHTKAIIMSARNVTMIPQTETASRYQIDEMKVVNYGVDPQQLTKEYGSDIRHLQMIDVTFPEGIEATRLNENQVAVFRPRIDLRSEVAAPANSIELGRLTKEELLKQQKNITSALDMYHKAEDKSLERIHKQQSAETKNISDAELQAQQKRELDSLDKLHTRELDVLIKRFDREQKMQGNM